MRRAAAVLSLTVLAGSALAAEDVRTLRRDFVLEPGQSLLLDLPTAEVTIEGGSGDEVRAELVLTCARLSRSCRERAEEIALASRIRGGRLVLEIEGVPEPVRRRPSLALALRVPRERALAIDLGVGEVDVYGMVGDLLIDVGVGEVDVEIAEHKVRSVRLDVGLGGVELKPEPQGMASSGFLFLGQEVSWCGGPGQAQVAVDVGVGEVDVVMSQTVAMH